MNIAQGLPLIVGFKELTEKSKKKPKEEPKKVRRPRGVTVYSSTLGFCRDCGERRK